LSGAALTALRQAKATEQNGEPARASQEQD